MKKTALLVGLLATIAIVCLGCAPQASASTTPVAVAAEPLQGEVAVLARAPQVPPPVTHRQPTKVIVKLEVRV